MQPWRALESSHKADTSIEDAGHQSCSDMAGVPADVLNVSSRNNTPALTAAVVTPPMPEMSEMSEMLQIRGMSQPWYTAQHHSAATQLQHVICLALLRSC